jgi:hypothetical protein
MSSTRAKQTMADAQNVARSYLAQRLGEDVLRYTKGETVYADIAKISGDTRHAVGPLEVVSESGNELQLRTRGGFYFWVRKSVISRKPFA